MKDLNIQILKSINIQCDNGLSEEEIDKIEKLYDIVFPKSMKKFLKEVVPICDGFYNWRDMSEENVEYIKSKIATPIKNFYNEAKDAILGEDWKDELEKCTKIEEVRRRLEEAPKLIPVFAHRYIPMDSGDNPPVISVYGVDIIYYGENLKDYISIEFGEKSQSEIDFENIQRIRFWSDVM